MKKTLSVLFLLIFAFSLHAALPVNTTTWEIRPGVGVDTSGGCFVTGASGTDFSKQNSPQYNNTDLASVSALVVSSASHNFVASDVGNCINITAGSGFTAGFYEIVSVSVNQATLDRSPGTVGVGGTYAVGGALNLPQTANTNLTSGNTVWMKATGSVTFSAVMTMQTLGTSVPIQFIGYTTTRGDNGRVTWTTSTNSIAIVHIATAAAYGFVFQNIDFETTAGTKGPGLSTVSSGGSENGAISVINCKFNGFTVAIYGNNDNNTYYFRQLLIVNSEITGSTGGGITGAYSILNAGSTFIYGSYIHDNSVGGFCNGCTPGSGQQSAGDLVIGYSIIYNNTGIGVSVSGGDLPTGNWLTVNIFNSDFVANTVDGIALVNSTASSGQIWNSIFYDNGTSGAGYGINMTVGSPGTQTSAFNNAYRLNHDGATKNYPTSSGDVTLTASPFVSIGSDFSLNNNAGGGKALKGTGYPGVLTTSVGTGYTSIGALAPNPNAGGGQVGFGFTQ